MGCLRLQTSSPTCSDVPHALHCTHKPSEDLALPLRPSPVLEKKIQNYTSSCGMKPKQADVPHRQARPAGPALGGPYCQVSSSPAATGRLVANSTRGSSEPVRLQKTPGEGRLHKSCYQKWVTPCSALWLCMLQPATARQYWAGPCPPAQQQLQVTTTAAVVEEARKVPALCCVNVQPHGSCAARQPLAQHLGTAGQRQAGLKRHQEQPCEWGTLFCVFWFCLLAICPPEAHALSACRAANSRPRRHRTGCSLTGGEDPPAARARCPLRHTLPAAFVPQRLICTPLHTMVQQQTGDNARRVGQTATLAPSGRQAIGQQAGAQQSTLCHAPDIAAALQGVARGQRRTSPCPPALGGRLPRELRHRRCQSCMRTCQSRHRRGHMPSALVLPALWVAAQSSGPAQEGPGTMRRRGRCLARNCRRRSRSPHALACHHPRACIPRSTRSPPVLGRQGKVGLQLGWACSLAASLYARACCVGFAEE